MSTNPVIPDQLNRLMMLKALAQNGPALQTSSPASTAMIPPVPLSVAPKMDRLPSPSLATQSPQSTAMIPPVQASQPPATGMINPTMKTPDLGNPSMPTVLPPTQMDLQDQATQKRTMGDINRYNYLDNSGSGISQITHPVDPTTGMPTTQKPSLLRRFGGALARIGDTALSIAAPGFDAMIPGTEMHHNMLLHQQQGRVVNDLGQQQAEAQTAYTNAEPELRMLTGQNQQLRNMAYLESVQGRNQHYTAQDYNAQHPVARTPDMATYSQLTGMGMSPSEALGEIEKEHALGAKPPAPNMLAMWLQEHPGGTAEQYLAMQNAIKPEFPRIVPVNDAQGNTVGYNTFSGTGGGVKVQYVPASQIAGLPQTLGEQPGVIPPKPTSTVLTQSQRAEMIQPQVEALNGQIDATAKDLGPAAGRWNQVMVGKVGANNPAVAKLQVQLQAFTTAFMLSHGLRGEGYEKEIGSYLGMAQSPADLKARVAGLNGYLQDYANYTGHGSQPFTRGAQSPTPQPELPPQSSNNPAFDTKIYMGHTYVKGANGSWELQP